MATAGGPALAATVGMINRIHDDAANRRTDATPACSASFTKLAQVIFGVSDFADDRAAIRMNLAHFSAAQAHRRVLPLTRNQLRGCTCRSRQLRALTWPHLDTMHLRTNRNVPQWHAITDNNRHTFSRLYLTACLDTLRRNDIGTLAVSILKKRQVSAPIRVVLQSLHYRGDTVFLSLEIDDPVVLLVTTALVTYRDTPRVIAPTMTRLLLKQGLVGITLMEVG